MSEPKTKNTQKPADSSGVVHDSGASVGSELDPTIPHYVATAGRSPVRVVVSFGRIAVVLLVVVLAAFGVHHFLPKDRHTVAQSAKQKQPTSSAVVPPAKSATSQPLQLTTVDATYLAAPKQVGDLQVFATPSNLGQICTNGDDCRPVVSTDVHYYLIGTTKDGRQILVFVAPTGGPGDDEEIMLGSKGKYQILAQMDSGSADAIKRAGAAAFIKDNSANFSSNVSYDVTTRLDGLSFPATVTAKGQTFVRDYDDGEGNYGYFLPQGLTDIRGNGYGSTTVTPTELGTDGGKTVYSLVAKDDTSFRVIETYAAYGKLFAFRYDPQSSLLGTNGAYKTLDVNWKSGAQNKSTYFSAASGCGTAGYVVAKGVTADMLAQVGTSSDGQALYQLPNAAPLSQELYGKDYGESKAYLDDASLRNMTMQQFMDNHAYVLFKDTLGEYIVLQRSDMFQTGGCAKPVVYLYPQQKTSVTVRVGARVTRSDPQYVTGGWQNVIAEPSGALNYRGKGYDSLFWEGQGYGGYPAITSGVVVPSSKAVVTIKNQLKAQGLNAKEAADFLAYWGSKLPKTPYVRLTWLNTAQMNELAPLTVSPEPQTVIRVFLDFEGLQLPENLPSQQFVAPARHGFTVVEWGGLARNGLHG